MMKRLVVVDGVEVDLSEVGQLNWKAYSDKGELLAEGAELDPRMDIVRKLASQHPGSVLVVDDTARAEEFAQLTACH